MSLGHSGLGPGSSAGVIGMRSNAMASAPKPSTGSIMPLRVLLRTRRRRAYGCRVARRRAARHVRREPGAEHPRRPARYDEHDQHDEDDDLGHAPPTGGLG